ncbi:hypothetical protein UFOVP437_20 [uncultured Caudovirales phage]|uniref:Uncharacterized protein n=1 Tax=uncultured Caudovirales phage TaxID=2100421 RepID=A0A6J5M6B4_9CAUD|nr:hypothetical protein UFOVP437_20 [uncultured Caudovirales phage]
MAYKVFTNGSVLQASEINDNLMRQSVMVFSNAAARTAAITVPLEGMLTWLEDLNRYESYNGSAWVVESSGVVLLNTTSFSAATSVSVNNVFSSLYDNYKITFNMNSSSTSGINYGLRLRTSGTDNNASNYRFGSYFIGSEVTQPASGNNNTTNTYWTLGNISTAGSTAEITLHRPFLTQRTAISSVGSGTFLWVLGGQSTVTTSYDGFSIIIDGAGNMTGTLSVYGLAK